jgi:hypothetical protein
MGGKPVTDRQIVEIMEQTLLRDRDACVVKRISKKVRRGLRSIQSGRAIGRYRNVDRVQCATTIALRELEREEHGNTAEYDRLLPLGGWDPALLDELTRGAL